MRRAILATVLILVGFTTLRGDPLPTKPTIEQLIEQLDDKDFKVRQVAEKVIEQMGPDALPALRRALEAKPSLEVSQRIDKWIPQFELAALTNPKRVTLSVTRKPLQEVVEQIANQTGYTIVLVPSEEREKKPHDFKFDRVTLWEALDSVCNAGELTVGRDAEQKLQLSFSDKHQPFVYRQGAFRVIATGFHYSYSRQRSNQFEMVARKPGDGKEQAQSSESEFLQFTLKVQAEPGLPLLGLGEVVVTEATDDQKQSVEPEMAANRMMFGRRGFAASSAGGFGERNLQSWVPLKAPSKNAKAIALLKGTVAVQLEKEKKTTVLAEKVLDAKGKKFKFGETALEIDEVKKGDNQEVDIYLSARGGQAGEGQLDGELQLLDEKGNAYQIGRSGASSDGVTARMHLTFISPGVAGPPTKLVYTRRVTVDYPLPFEFRDLPLP